MKRILTVLILIIFIFVIPALADPVDGEQHDCNKDPHIIIIYNASTGEWFWHILAPDGSNVNPEETVPWQSVSVDRCPACGCSPQYSRCWIWEGGGGD